jgi:hypothetical protein
MSAQHSIGLGEQWASAGVTQRRLMIHSQFQWFFSCTQRLGGEKNLFDIHLDHLGIHAPGRSLRGHGDGGGAFG